MEGCSDLPLGPGSMIRLLAKPATVDPAVLPTYLATQEGTRHTTIRGRRDLILSRQTGETTDTRQER
jgi:hypothetical protein